MSIVKILKIAPLIIIGAFAFLFVLHHLYESGRQMQAEQIRQNQTSTQMHDSTEVVPRIYVLEPGAPPIKINVNGQYLRVKYRSINLEGQKTAKSRFTLIDGNVVLWEMPDGTETVWLDFANKYYGPTSTVERHLVKFIELGVPSGGRLAEVKVSLSNRPFSS